jgi:hypothetical protein
MRIPRVQFTIRRLMIAVLVVSLVLTVVAARLAQRRRAVELQAARASYLFAVLTREVAEIAAVEYTEAIYKKDLATPKAERERTVNELKNEVEKARSDELKWKAIHDRLKAAGTGLFW